MLRNHMPRLDIKCNSKVLKFHSYKIVLQCNIAHIIRRNIGKSLGKLSILSFNFHKNISGFAFDGIEIEFGLVG
jgi:hypothetical protein